MYVPNIRKLNEKQVQQLKIKYEIVKPSLSLPLIHLSDPLIKSYNLINTTDEIKVGDIIVAQGHATPFCIVR